MACVTRSARDGFWGGLSCVFGHAALELLTVVGLTLGLGALLVRPGVAPAVSLLGGLVLVWMGYGTARSAVRGDMTITTPEHTGRKVRPGGTAELGAAVAAAGRRSGPGGAVGRFPAAGGGPVGLAGATVTGVAATVSNPFFVIWWATVGLSYLTMAAPLGSVGAGAFYIGHVLSDFTWYAALAAAVAGGRRLLSGRGYRFLLAVCGLLLLGLGAVFAGKGFLTLV